MDTNKKPSIDERLKGLESQYQSLQQEAEKAQRELSVKQQQLLMMEGAISVLREYAAASPPAHPASELERLHEKVEQDTAHQHGGREGQG